MTATNSVMLCSELLESEVNTLKQDEYCWESKMDGLRALLTTNNQGGIDCLTLRNGRECKRMFPELDCLGYPRNSVLDGELCVVKNGISDFNSVMARKQTKSFILMSQLLPVTFIVFDCLKFEGKNVIKTGFKARRALLEAVKVFPPNTTLITQYRTFSEAWGGVESKEGVVGKKLDALYVAGIRSHAQIKVKRWKTALLPVLGFESRQRDIAVLQTSQGLVNFVVAENVRLFWENKIRNKIALKVLVRFLELTKDNRMRMPVMVKLVEA